MHDSLLRVMRRCLWVTLLAYGALVPLSYGLAAFSPREVRMPVKIAGLQSFVAALPLVPAPVRKALVSYVGGESVLANRIVRNVAYSLPILIATLCFLYLIYRLSTAVEISPAITTLLFRGAIAIAAVQLFAYPIFTADFWLYIVWGRMAADGVNPYYAGITPEAMRGIPMSDWGEVATYGPGWTLVTAALAQLGMRLAVLDFVLMKLLIAGTWIATLFFVRRAAALRSPLHEAMATAIFGWVPISSFMSVAEAHNDVAMALLMTVWLYFMLAGRMLSAPLALIGSVLFKYASAPLVLVEGLRIVFVNRPPLRRYIGTVLAGLLVAAGCFAIFARGWDFFARTKRLTHWAFWTPSDALRDTFLLAGLGFPRTVALGVVAVALAATAVYYLIRFLKSRSTWDLVPVALVLQSAMLFLGAGHVWPWYAAWLIPMTALAWDKVIGRALLALALAIPLLNIHWLIPHDPRVKPYLGILTYTTALLLLPLLGRWHGRGSSALAKGPEAPVPTFAPRAPV